MQFVIHFKIWRGAPVRGGAHACKRVLTSYVGAAYRPWNPRAVGDIGVASVVAEESVCGVRRVGDIMPARVVWNKSPRYVISGMLLVLSNFPPRDVLI